MRELTKPGGLFLVTNPNGSKISKYEQNKVNRRLEKISIMESSK